MRGRGDASMRVRERELMIRRLYEASVDGNVISLMELLVEDKLILDRAIVTCFDETPLHIAAMLGHIDFAREILSRQKELATELDSEGSSPLHLASAKGYTEIVKELLRINPDVCCVTDKDGRTPLHLAAMKGRVDVIKELIQAKPKVIQTRVDRGETIMHLCVKHNRLEALKLLVELVTDYEFINSTDDDGNTVLHLAAAMKHTESIKFLLDRTGVRVNALNGNGFTALDVLAQSPRNMKDMEIGESLRNAGSLRVRDIPAAAHDTEAIRRRDMSQVASDRVAMSCSTGRIAHPLSRGISLKNHFKKHDDWLEKKRSALMVAATVIASMAFQAGVNPPGGVWQDNKSNEKIVAGESIMATNNPDDYNWFLIFNTTSFHASLSIILLLVSGLPLKQRIVMWILMAIMWVTTTSMVLTYLVSITTFTPDRTAAVFKLVRGISVYMWLGLMIIVLLVHVARLVFWFMKKLLSIFMWLGLMAFLSVVHIAQLIIWILKKVTGWIGHSSSTIHNLPNV